MAEDQGTETPSGEEQEATERPRPSRRTLILLVAPIVVLSVAGTIATAFTPALATKHPLALIMLDARNRMLVLARDVDLVPFVIVAVLRRTLSDPLFYLLGRFYGEGAIRWLERKGGGGGLVTLTEKLFRRAGYPMVFLFPGAIVCALAGTTGMPIAGFVAANLAGTIVSIFAVRAFSGVVASPVEALLGFFERNLVATTSITVGLVVLSLLLNGLQGKLETRSLKELESELESGDDSPGVEPGSQTVAGPASESGSATGSGSAPGS